MNELSEIFGRKNISYSDLKRAKIRKYGLEYFIIITFLIQ